MLVVGVGHDRVAPVELAREVHVRAVGEGVRPVEVGAEAVEAVGVGVVGAGVEAVVGDQVPAAVHGLRPLLGAQRAHLGQERHALLPVLAGLGPGGMPGRRGRRLGGRDRIRGREPLARDPGLAARAGLGRARGVVELDARAALPDVDHAALDRQPLARTQHDPVARAQAIDATAVERGAAGLAVDDAQLQALGVGRLLGRRREQRAAQRQRSEPVPALEHQRPPRLRFSSTSSRTPWQSTHSTGSGR